MGKLRIQAQGRIARDAEDESLSFQGSVAISQSGRKERKGVCSTSSQVTCFFRPYPGERGP